MHDTYIQSEKEFREKFVRDDGLMDKYIYLEHIDDNGVPECITTSEAIQSHIRTTLIKQFQAYVKELEGERKEDYTEKDIEDRLKVFTLTPLSAESIKEFTRVISDISSKLGHTKALNLAIEKANNFIKYLEQR